MSQKLEILIQGKDQLSPAAQSAQKSLNEIGIAADGADKKTTSLWRQMAGGALVAQGVTMAVGALARGIKDFVASSVTAYNEQAKVEAQLENVLRSTGQAAGWNAEQLKKMAAELQKTTAVGDEAVIGAQNLLLTFTQIGGETFPRATEAILDVSQAMGQDLKTSAIQVGKALNDPIAGLGSLSRVGIQFTETQKDMIKGFVEMGEVSKAQGVILQELERQFGGSAAAFAKTFQGQMEQFKNAWGDMKEEIGGAIVQELRPMLESVTKWFQENRTEIVSFAKGVVNAFGDIAGAVGQVLGLLYKVRGVIAVIPQVMSPGSGIHKMAMEQLKQQAKDYEEAFFGEKGPRAMMSKDIVLTEKTVLAVQKEQVVVVEKVVKLQKESAKAMKAIKEETKETALTMPRIKNAIAPVPGLMNDVDLELNAVNLGTGKVVDSWSELNAKADLFQKALGSVFGALDAIGIKTGNLGSVFGTALGGAQAGFGMLSAAKDATGFDAILGKVAGYAAIASAAIGLLGGLADALGFTRTGLDDTIEGLERAGVSINDNLVKQLEEAREAGKDVGAEMARVTADIIRDTELTGQNFGTLSQMVRDVFMQFDNGRLSVEEATKAYGKAFTELARKAEDAGLAGSKALADMISDARTRGMVGSDMLAYVDPARMSGLNAMAAHIRATSDTAAGFAAAQRQAMAFFQSMQADGKGVIEIIEALGPALDELKATGEAQGYDVGYLSQLFGMRDFLEQNKDVIEGIQATQAVMDSMAKTGILTQERFTEFAASTWDYYNKLADEGKTSEQALQALLPMLGKQLWYAEQYGFELDENTRKLIEEAKAQGLKLDAAIPAEERMAAGIEKLVELFEKLTGGIDGTTGAIGRMADAAGKVRFPDWEFDGDPGPGEELTGFATGTRGFQRLPSTYIVGENGPELVRQSGGRTSITPMGGTGHGQTIQLLLPNVRDPYSAQQLKRDLEMNEAGLTTYIAARVGRG